MEMRSDWPYVLGSFVLLGLLAIAAAIYFQPSYSLQGNLRLNERSGEVEYCDTYSGSGDSYSQKCGVELRRAKEK